MNTRTFALAAALFTNFLAWGGYGLSLQLLLLGTMDGVRLAWGVATGAFAASRTALSKAGQSESHSETTIASRSQ